MTQVDSRTTEDFDHARRCSPRDVAEGRRDALRNRIGNIDNEGRVLRWRVRFCHACAGYFVAREHRR